MFGVELNEVLVDISKFDFSKADKALAFGGTMLLIGMLTVFTVLCTLWLCLTLFKIFFHDLPERKKVAAPAAKVEAPVISAPSSVKTNDDEIVAVIAAAIAMAESENSNLKFRVVSFRRK